MLSYDDENNLHNENVQQGFEYLYSSYPFLMNYFKNGINNKNKNIAHCILLFGTDIQAQYDMALEVARLLNCTGTHTSDCQCLNCHWIRENKHPAVLTISKVDNKPVSDTSKTVISIDQARAIKNDLLITSEYHRVFIFCDKDKDGNVCGINNMNFQEPTANALLKTFEEPPERTTFFFLTKDKSDILSTIISRAQSFFVPARKIEPGNFELVYEAIDGYFNLERDEVLDLNDKIFELTKENDAANVLTQIQNYMNAALKNNIYNNHLKMKLIQDIKAVENAQKQVTLNMNLQTVIENLAFELVLK